ncbi:MAG: hypothetical protein R3D56_04170 [Paracoccaceae bacterium]
MRTATILSEGEPREVEIEALRPAIWSSSGLGERIATDGEVTEGESHVDESMITGEPCRSPRRRVLPSPAAMVNGAGSLTFRATARRR